MMTTVVVCNTDINELLYLIDCKLGELATDFLYAKLYAIDSCNEIKSTMNLLINYKKILLDIIKNRHSADNMIYSINYPTICGICEKYIEFVIEKIKDLLKHCINCKGVKLTTLEIVTINPQWYNTQEYLDCLQIQLEEEGWIEPLIDLCQNLNIEISFEKLCKDIAVELSLQKVDCMNLSEIQITNAFQIISGKFNN